MRVLQIRNVALLSVVILLAGLYYSLASAAQQRKLDDRLLAQVVTSLVQYMKWQERDYKNNITLCTLGLSAVGRNIKDLKLPNIKVRERPDSVNWSKCHIVFIDSSEQNQLGEILWKLKPFQVVSMSDISGFTEAGGTIQLVTDTSKLSFKININSAKEAKVVIDSDLLNISEIVSE